MAIDNDSEALSVRGSDSELSEAYFGVHDERSFSSYDSDESELRAIAGSLQDTWMTTSSDVLQRITTLNHCPLSHQKTSNFQLMMLKIAMMTNLTLQLQKLPHSTINKMSAHPS
jgi:hypothetical protein